MSFLCISDFYDLSAGLVMQLKNAVGEKFIFSRERELIKKAKLKLEKLDNLILLGNALTGQDDNDGHGHLPVLSFVIKAPQGSML
jgi:hypothetical protein